MAGRCKICFHPKRLEIENEIMMGFRERIRGERRLFSYRKIALRYGLSKSAIGHHYREHMLRPQAKEIRAALGLDNPETIEWARQWRESLGRIFKSNGG